MLIYVVKEGDTVDRIATAYNIPVNSILYINQIPYPYSLAIGQSLLLPAEGISAEMPALVPPVEPGGLAAAPSPAPAVGSPVTPLQWDPRSIYTGGYAYPFINPWILSQTLPFLSYLYVFSYGFTMDGELIPPQLDDTFMITQAKVQGSSPILTLTPFGPDGHFNNALISRVVNDLAARRRLKDEIVAQITQRGFEGLDIDFEYILATDRDAFVDFVAYMQESISPLGYPVSVALAPKTSDTQVGLLYEGKDYARLGAVADYVLLMTYEWGYTYGPPMAVAPLNKVREVVEYALTVIPAEKIHLGIPNYGYDWALPFVRGQSKAVTLGNVEAVQLAIRYGVPIQFDDVALSPFFFYETMDDAGRTTRHEVWFEDVRSYNEKMNLVSQYKLRGISCWQIMQLFRAGWMLIDNRFPIYKNQ